MVMLSPLVVFFACAQSKLGAIEQTEEPETTLDSGQMDGDSGLDADGVQDELWWTLSATLVLQKGEIVPESTFSVTLRNGAGEPVCEQPTDFVFRSVEAATPPYESLLTWWTVQLEPTGTFCDGEMDWWQQPVHLGVGEMHPDVLAASETMDTLHARDHLNGAYIAFDDDPELVMAFGVAGTAAQFSAEQGPAQKAPLDDGEWNLMSVYWFTAETSAN